MSEITGGLQYSLTATAVIPPYRLVKYGAADGTMTLAVDATAAIIGVGSDLQTEIGEHGDVFSTSNRKDVTLGGTVTRGDPLTADATGRAIVATTAGQRCVGFAHKSGVVGDIGSVNIAPFIF